eukprot:scaffold1571_cov124-Isochrysis_galbana.AAC.1
MVRQAGSHRRAGGGGSVGGQARRAEEASEAPPCLHTAWSPHDFTFFATARAPRSRSAAPSPVRSPAQLSFFFSAGTRRLSPLHIPHTPVPIRPR